MGQAVRPPARTAASAWTTWTRKTAARSRPCPTRRRWSTFPTAIRTRKQAGGHAEAAHRTATLLHLTNVSIRVGRKIKFDPVKEEVIGDEEANRLVNQPMRAPWHI